MVDFAKAKGREIMSEPSPQLNSELLSQLDALMQAREQAARDARRAAWRGLFGSLKKPLLITVWSAAWLGAGFVTRVWMDGGIEIGPGNNDVLQQSFDADRKSQIAILREYAAQGFVNDDAGREAATKWFNDHRFRNRSEDYKPYTTAVVDHFAAGTLEQFADELEGK